MTEQNFDEVYDVVVVGTGGAGFATAMGAFDEGLSVLLVEGSDKWGGNTSMSGGGMWLPNNPLMRRDKVGDSREEALEYMEVTVGDEGRSTSRERKEAFVDGVDDFVDTAEKYGMRFSRAADYPDYYPELPGGKIGRAIEGTPTDGKSIGQWWDTMRGAVPLPAMTDDVWELGRAWSTPSGMVRGARLVGRAFGGVVTGKRLTGIGSGLMTQFAKAMLVDNDVPMWLNAPLKDLIVEDGRVVGAIIEKDGVPLRVGAKKGVMLAAGGFESNPQWRQEYQNAQPETSGAPSNKGETTQIAMDHGAAVELMDDAWWGGSLGGTETGDPSFIVGERSMPFSLMVDSTGRRFVNESESYVDLGHHMLEHDGGAGPYWMIWESRALRRYLRTFALDPKENKNRMREGILVKAKTVDDLAAGIGVDPAVLKDTFGRFNGFARAGIDGDFGRGNSAYDRYYGDPLVKPNPNLGPLEKGPFVAHKIVLGDLGTKGGIVTDEFARALREDGTVIEGLYSAGNNSASVMGRTYPGPGSTIGPAAVFGVIAGRHMARK